MGYNIGPVERKGSSKNISRVLGRPDLLAMGFSDRVSIFDRGPFKTEFTKLGKLRCAISTHVMQHLQNSGICTHFLEKYADSTMLVKQVAVPELGETDAWNGGWELIPLEVLWRRKVTEKFLDRLKKSPPLAHTLRYVTKLDSALLSVGDAIDPTFVECSTKFEAQDRYLCDADAAECGRLTASELERLYDFTRMVVFAITELFGADLDVLTGKLEIAYHRGYKRFMVCDSITPDELELGNGFDKNPVRGYFKKNYPEWFSALNHAKELFPEDKSKWPDYPAEPPAQLVTLMANQYSYVARKIGCSVLC